MKIVMLVMLVCVTGAGGYCIGRLTLPKAEINAIEFRPPSPWAPPKWNFAIADHLWYTGDRPFVIRCMNVTSDDAGLTIEPNENKECMSKAVIKP